MKSLAERKKFRAEQRSEQLKESGVVNQDTGITQEGEGSDTDFDGMTIDQLKDAAKGMGSEVPKEKTKKDEVLLFVKNLAAFKAQEQAEAEQAGGGWKSGN